MVRALKEVSVDGAGVGWYSSFYLSSSFTPDTLAHQARFQAAVPSAVLLAYDNVRTAQGHLSLRALRLTDAAMAAYRAAAADVARAARGGFADPDRVDKAIAAHEAFAALAPSSLFEEVPLKIRNPHLLSALLVDLVDTPALSATAAPAPGAGAAGHGAAGAAGGASAGTIGGAAVAGAAAAAAGGAGAGGVGGAPAEGATDLARLDVSVGPYLEKHLEMLNDFMADMARVQDSAAYLQRRALRMAREREEWIARRRRENEERAAAGMAPLPDEDYSLPFFQPVRDRGAASKDPLEAHLMAAQVSNYCTNVSRFAHQNFGKLFLLSSLGKA
jgi:translation initiation factor 3 subunit H